MSSSLSAVYIRDFCLQSRTEEGDSYHMYRNSAEEGGGGLTLLAVGVS
jgi:hypothetical protein